MHYTVFKIDNNKIKNNIKTFLITISIATTLIVSPTRSFASGKSIFSKIKSSVTHIFTNDNNDRTEDRARRSHALADALLAFTTKAPQISKGIINDQANLLPPAESIPYVTSPTSSVETLDCKPHSPTTKSTQTSDFILSLLNNVDLAHDASTTIITSSHIAPTPAIPSSNDDLVSQLYDSSTTPPPPILLAPDAISDVRNQTSTIPNNHEVLKTTSTVVTTTTSNDGLVSQLHDSSTTAPPPILLAPPDAISDVRNQTSTIPNNHEVLKTTSTVVTTTTSNDSLVSQLHDSSTTAPPPILPAPDAISGVRNQTSTDSDVTNFIAKNVFKEVDNITILMLNITNIAHSMANFNIVNRFFYHLLPALMPVAAGDANSFTNNVWVNGTYGTTNYNGKNKYLGKTYVTTIGADKALSDNSIIGVAYNYIISNFKHKNYSDKKVTAKHHLISFYSQYDFSSKIATQGVATIGFCNAYTKSSTKNKASYSTEVSLIYKGSIDDLWISPKVGIKYGSYNVGGYTQNLGAQSISIASTYNKKTAVVVGIKTNIVIMVNNITIIIPELHTEVEKFLYNKQSKLNIHTLNSNKSRKYSALYSELTQYGYKIGGSLSIKNGRTEIIATCDYWKSNRKYFNRQGSIGLKVAL